MIIEKLVSFEINHKCISKIAAKNSMVNPAKTFSQDNIKTGF